MTGVWQQVFALDARYNTHRAPLSHTFRTMYIRRRNQLLKKLLQKAEMSEERMNYMRIRSILLQRRYAVTPADTRSLCSASRSCQQSDVGGGGGVVPTREAAASRALVGGTSISENYAFVGVAHIFDTHTAPVTWVKFANNDKERLICAGNDGLVSVCVVSDPPHVLHVLRGHVGAVTCADWSSDNDVIASGGVDGTLRLWRASSGDSLRSVATPGRAGVGACVFQPTNNNVLIVGTSDGTVALLNTSAGIFPKSGSAKVGGAVLSLCCDATGHILWAGNNRGSVTSLRMTSDRLIRLRRVVLSPNRAVTSLSYRQWVSREARDPTLLVNCAANAVFVFRVVDAEGAVALKNRLPIRHESHPVRSTFCPIMSFREGTPIVTASEDCCVYVLDVERKDERAVINKLQGHATSVLSVSFNYDESLLATSDLTGLVILWRRDITTA